MTTQQKYVPCESDGVPLRASTTVDDGVWYGTCVLCWQSVWMDGERLASHVRPCPLVGGAVSGRDRIVMPSSPPADGEPFGPILDFGDDDCHPLTRVEAIALRDRLDGWLAATVGALGNDTPCPGGSECAGQRPWFDRDAERAGALRCELCGGEVEF